MIVAVLAAIAGAVTIAGYREARQPMAAAHYRIEVQKALPARRALHIVFLADLHAGLPDMPPARLSAIVTAVNALKPDLILLGGDYVKGTPLGIGEIPVEQAIAPLGALSARLGVVAVLGNNDCAQGRADTIGRLLAAQGITVLRNQAALLAGVAVLGVDDVIHCKGNMGPVKADFARQLKARGMTDWPYPVVLLSHEPAFALYAPPYADVALAGHTHGGQMFPSITGRIIAWQNGLSAARGLMRAKGRPLIVSSGVGTNNLPLRIGVPPEIVQLTLAERTN